VGADTSHAGQLHSVGQAVSQALERSHRTGVSTTQTVAVTSWQSGWNYDDWRGAFYPETLPRGEELAYVGERFDTVEVNGTFYGLAGPDSFERWRDVVPASTVLAVKGSRFITHNKKLRGTGTAAELARGHDERVENPAYGPGTNHRMRHVLEVRHDSYLCDQMVAIARRHGVALAVSHASTWPYTEEVTAGFVYVRLHGPDEPYASAYDEEALARWASRLQQWRDAQQPADAYTITDRRPPRRQGRDVYVYFNNDKGGHAPHQAARLLELLRRP